MANAIYQGFMVLDTASATVYTKNQYMVTGVRYVSSGAAAGSECKLEDQSGHVFFDSVASGADWNDGQTINLGGILINGLIVATLSDGTVYLYFK